MKPVEPIHLVELFPPLSRELLALLKSLQPAEWALPTACPSWSVKDVAAHLLGGNLGRLWDRTEISASPEKTARDFNELVDLINRDNESWVRAAQRISPRTLVEFLELTDGHLYDRFRYLPQDEPARITVAWAGDDLPPNWFGIAREYTEKWLHQQHIREATGRPLLTERTWLAPALDTFMRGLPRAYRNVEAENGASVSIRISGEAGGEWSLVRENSGWQLFAGLEHRSKCSVQIGQDLAWRLFTKGVSREDARQRVQISGNAALGEPVLEMVSIMA